MQRRILFLFLLFLCPDVIWACTALYLENINGGMVAKNYDWENPYGYLMVNKQNIRKKALTEDPYPAQWVSKFGSVTFNQYGSGFPQGGINTEGLVVEVLWLSSALFPEKDNRPTLNELQWIQYQLDSYSSTKEVVQHLEDIRISSDRATVHYFICDSSGDCAVIEPIHKKMEVSIPSALPLKLITNSTYQDSLRFEANPLGLEATASLKRFAKGAHLLRDLQPQQEIQGIQASFNLLGNLREEDTVWSIVYDLKNKSISWKSQINPHVQMIKMDQLKFSCLQPTQFLEILKSYLESPLSGLNLLSKTSNQKLIEFGLGDPSIPEDFRKKAVEALTTYPEKYTSCVESHQ